jgi:hypothetical protein
MFGTIITFGTFSVVGTIFVTGTGGVSTPAGNCPVGMRCILYQDAGTPAVNGKVNVLPLGLPSGNIPAAMAGADGANIFSQMDPPDTPPSFPAVPFMSFNNDGITTVLQLTKFPLGVDGPGQCALPPAAGQICTVPGSPFNLQNLTATSSSITWTMGGVSADGRSTWTGTFSSQFNDIPYQTVLNNSNITGFATDGFSGQITLVEIPEPGTVPMLVGAGMIACAALLRRFTRSKSDL